MSNDIVPFEHQERIANAIAKSGLFGIKTADQALALMAVAQAEGRHPGSVARDYHIIQGRPALKADAMMARFQQAGGKVKWTKYTDQEVTGVFSHPSGGDCEITWTVDMAKRIGLATKDNWRNYPRQMLRARVISEGIRTVYPGVIVGEYTPEEVQDFGPSHEIKDVTPKEVKPNGAEQAPQDANAKPVAPAQPDPPAPPAGVPLMTPGNDLPYDTCDDVPAFIAEFNHLVTRIKQSKKILDENKAPKIAALWQANNETIAKFSETERQQLNG